MRTMRVYHQGPVSTRGADLLPVLYLRCLARFESMLLVPSNPDHCFHSTSTHVHTPSIRPTSAFALGNHHWGIVRVSPGRRRSAPSAGVASRSEYGPVHNQPPAHTRDAVS
eukprot:COSAG02_NODE_254_length_26937_cov_16.503950_8_plen_111_part_00